jgi:hypothetical protein
MILDFLLHGGNRLDAFEIICNPAVSHVGEQPHCRIPGSTFLHLPVTSM